MPTLPSRHIGALRLALMAGMLAFAPGGAEAFTTRYPQRAVGWHGHQAQRMKPARVAKGVPAKLQAKAAPTAKPVEEPAPARAVERNGTWTAGESGGRACFRSRRKLWQADEGWIVKKVNVCP